MHQAETKRFNELYQRHLRLLKLQGKAQKTIDAYSRAVRRIRDFFDCCPDLLTLDQRETYFSNLVQSHSWSTVKIDRNGLQFFWKHVLDRDWQWVNIVKAPKVQSLPDILTISEVEQLIGATNKLRYRTFLLTTYSMGLRLGEALALQVGDIDENENRFIFAVVRAIRTVSFHFPISLIRHCAPCGASIATHAGCSPMPWVHLSIFRRPPPIWIEAALKLP
jgi:integrase/recombinase XerD